jgi:phosphate transport system permease protein
MADQTLILTRPARPDWPDRIIISLLAAAASVAILVTAGIVLSLIF